MNRSRRGSVALDFLFTIIPILLMLQYTLGYSHAYLGKTKEGLERQLVFDRLVSVSDYVVKNLGAEKKEGLLFGEASIKPNLIDGSELSRIDSEQLAKDSGLRELSIGFSPSESGTCIYRLVVHEDEIKKLFFCGG